MTPTSRILLTATPLYGHVAPMLAIGCALRARGHQVGLLTGRAYEQSAVARGLEFTALPPAAEPQNSSLRRGSRLRVVAGREAIVDTFLRPLPFQRAALGAALADHDHDVLVSDAAFLGAMPMLFDAGQRLPTVGISLTPLSLASSDCAPFGSGLHPGRSAIARRRNELITWLLDHGPLRPLHRATDGVLDELGLRSGSFNYFDHAAAFDRTFHLAAPAIEYPRSDLPSSIEIVGPLRTQTASLDDLPEWWRDLDHDHRPVVHVTQGTMDNGDLGKLLIPTVRALADQPVRVVASTGGRDLGEVLAQLGGRLPGNVELTEFVDYGHLLPRCAVMITNGGYGGVQQALYHAVPVIVAGDSEEKPEVAARVSWAGVGRDLGTGRPSGRQIRSAVRSVLADQRARRRAADVAAELSDLGDPLPKIVAAVEQLVSSGPAVAIRPHATR